MSIPTSFLEDLIDSCVMEGGRLSGAFSSFLIHPSSLPLLLLAIIKQEGRV